jgi:hypothetical protein
MTDVKADRRGNFYPTKNRPDQQIDPAVALDDGYLPCHGGGRECGWTNRRSHCAVTLTA